MNEQIVYTSEIQVIKDMSLNNINKCKMYITAYVNSNGYQEFGFTVGNINSDYYLSQKTISKKTKTFAI
jgi:hypothetical protein